MEEEIQSAVDDSSDGAAAVAAERDQLAQEKAELHDRYLRLQAEFDNFRRRAERERMEFAEYAGMEIVRSLLTIVDDFERAIQAAAGTEAAGSELGKGIELIYNRLTDTLRKQGLEPIEAENTIFDPHLHHAVQREPNDEVEDGTVLAVYQRGYNFKGKLLRPAMVKVAAKG